MGGAHILCPTCVASTGDPKITVGRCRWWGLHKFGVPIKMISLSSEIILRCASPYTMAESQRLFFWPDSPPLIGWIAGHPYTTVSLPQPLVPPSGNIGNARQPPAPGRFNEDSDAEQRLASMCVAAMLLKYLIAPPTGRHIGHVQSSCRRGGTVLICHLYLTTTVHYTSCSECSSTDTSLLHSAASSSGAPTARASRTRSLL